MDFSLRKSHWETVYETKSPDQVSWTQKIPATSLEMIESFKLPKNAAIIDVGGGDSLLVDFLLSEGYSDVTVLDISSYALEKAKARMGDKSKLVKWIVNDITDFKPERKYDLWHDRATFHFLTSEDQIEKYLQITTDHAAKYMIIATFSEQGPLKCSGLEIKQYSTTSLAERFEADYQKVSCLNENHTTPFDTKQNFTFCAFKRKE